MFFSRSHLRAALCSVLVSQLPFALGFVLLYVAAAIFVLRYFTYNGVVAIFWPPTGLALAAVLVKGRGCLALVLIAAFVANTIAGIAPGTAVVFTLANTLQAWLGYEALNFRSSSAHTLGHANEYFRIVVRSVILAPVPSAMIGATTLHFAGLTQQNWLTNFQHWWMGDSLGVLVLTPLLLVWRRVPESWYASRQWVEGILGLVLAVLAGQIVFAGWFADVFRDYSHGFVLFVFVSWAAVRFGRHATAVIIGILVLQILYGVLNHSGYFYRSTTGMPLTSIWLYIFILAFVGMALAIFVHERKNSLCELTRAREYLQQATEIVRASVAGRWMS